MEDIKKAIEVLKYHQEWRKGAEIPQTDVKELTNALDTAIEILSKWQESERWRKVEEELPEVKEEEYFILCKMDSSQKYSIVLVHCEIDFKRYFRVVNITEWKPINK